MNCPMKELLKETATNTSKTSVDAAASAVTTRTTAATKTCVYACTTTAATASTAAGKKGVNVSDGRGCVNHQKFACTDCCALLAFKYIAACEDVVEFAHHFETGQVRVLPVESDTQ